MNLSVVVEAVEVLADDDSDGGRGRTADDLRSLYTWLRREPELHGLVEAVTRASEPGEMGGALDLLTVAVGAGGVVSVLANSLPAWLRQSRRSNVTLTVRRPDGSEVRLDVTNARDAPELLRTLMSQPPLAQPVSLAESDSGSEPDDPALPG